ERAWKRSRLGIEGDLTVADACRLYVANMRAEKGDEPADRTDGLFRRVLNGTQFSETLLTELQPLQVKARRNGIVTPRRKRNSANRIYRQFIAAMNYMIKRGVMETDFAWKSVRPFPVKDGTRNDYLTLEQRRALLDTCDRPKDDRELDADPKLLWATPDLG